MNRFFLSIVSLLVSLSMSGQLPFQKSEVKEVMKKVADWQIAHQKDVKHGTARLDQCRIVYGHARLGRTGGKRVRRHFLL